MESNKEFFLDEECVVTFHIGELGWLLQRWQGYLRYLKREVYQDRKFIIFMNPSFHAFVDDFITVTIDLPNWFYDLKLETDCYESPLPEAPAGGYTPPEIYKDLLQYFSQFYNTEKAIELWPPRGCNFWVDSKTQCFIRYESEPIILDKEIICVFPRGRGRASNRNVPEFVWRDLVDKLKEKYTVVLGGTPSGSCLSDYQSDNVINLISYYKPDKMDLIIKYLNSSIVSVSSQSGLTHVALLSGNCPAYIIGHEKQRHAVDENRTQVPVSFRVVPDYRAIDAETILSDLDAFFEALKGAGAYKTFCATDYDDVLERDAREFIRLSELRLQ